MLDAAADWTIEHLHGEQDGDSGNAVLIVDETSDVKSSADCAGAARQYCGATGGVALCQVAVTLRYAVPAGHALIGRALYLPADWAADEERRELAGVPDEVMFATKPELADRLLRHPERRATAVTNYNCRNSTQARPLPPYPITTSQPPSAVSVARDQAPSETAAESARNSPPGSGADVAPPSPE